MKKNWIKIVVISLVLIVIFGVLPLFERITNVYVYQKETDEASLQLNSSMEKLTKLPEYTGEVKELDGKHLSALLTLERIAIKTDYNFICYLGIAIGAFFIVIGIMFWKKNENFVNFPAIMVISGVGIIIIHIIVRIMSFV